MTDQTSRSKLEPGQEQTLHSLPPKVAVIVLNWNNAPDTLNCLESLHRQDYENFEIVVVDNGSTDDSVQAVNSVSYDLRLFELESNTGYSEGNNVGIRHALEQGADYVLIVNNDTVVSPSMLRKLVQFAESRPAAGLVGPMMYCLGKADTVFAAGSFIQWHKGLTWHRGMFEPAANYDNLSEPEPVDFISGCGILMKTSLIRRAGLLDPEYYLNFEDVEWAVRIRRLGAEVWLVPQARLWHRVSASLGQDSAINTYYLTRNALRFFGKYTPLHVRWFAVLNIVLRTLRTIAAWTFKPEYRGESFRKRRSANILALRDFLMGRKGQMKLETAITIGADK